MKKFLAFDSSGDELIVGVYNGKVYKEERLVASGTENLLPIIDKCLKSAKIKIDDIEVVAVGVGPGSWTGSRVALVTALGLISGKEGLRLVTFNSFDLISYNVKDKEKTLKLVKAYANFVYIQTETGEIKAITKDELDSCYGDYVLVGATKITDRTIVVPVDLEKISKVKVAEENYQNPDEVEPMYLRLSQAEYQRMDRLKEKH